MEKYLTLLRGINVGGKNKVPMVELKKAFEEVGFLDVKTYINSGNVVFSYNKTDEVLLQNKCHEIIKNAFQCDIKVMVINAMEFVEALDAAPKWWGIDTESQHFAIYVIAPTSAETIIDSVGETKDFEQVFSYGRTIFWSSPVKTFQETKWAKVSSMDIYNDITIRNAKTTRKLLEMIK